MAGIELTQLAEAAAWAVLTVWLLRHAGANPPLGRLAVATASLGTASAWSLARMLIPATAGGLTRAYLLSLLGSTVALLWFRDSFRPWGRRRWSLVGAVVVSLAAAVVVLPTQTPDPSTGTGHAPVAVAVFLTWLSGVFATVRGMWLQAASLSLVGRRRVRLTAAAILWAGLALTLRLALPGDTVIIVPETVVTILAGTAIALVARAPRWLRVMLRTEDPETEHIALERLALSLDRTDILEAAARAATQLTSARGVFVVDQGAVVWHQGMSAPRALQLSRLPAGIHASAYDGVATTVITHGTGSGILGVEAPAALAIHSGDEIDRLGELARTLGLALARSTLHEDLRAAKERSERLLEAVSDLGEGVAVSDGQRLLEANDALCAMTGYARDDLLSLPTLLHLVDPGLRRVTARQIAAVMDPDRDGDTPRTFDNVLVGRDGQRIDVRVVARRITDAGRPRIILAARDVTEERRVVRASRRRSLHLTALQELESHIAGMLAVPDILDRVTSTVGEIVGSGATGVLLFGTADVSFVSTDGLLEEEELALREALGRAEVRAALRHVPHDLVSSTLLGLPDGHRLAERSVCVAIRSDEGLLGMLVTGDRERGEFDEMDVAILRELASFVAERVMAVLAYTEQVHAVATLRSAHETKDLMLSTVAHDLRSPLATIATMGRTLAQHGDALPPEDRRAIAERVAARAEHLADLVAALLDLDRLSRGTLAAERTRTDVPSLLRGVIAQREDTERIHLDGVRTVQVEIDPTKTERIVANLVGNAVAHTDPGTPVWVSCRPHEGGVLIVVADAGPGVPPEDRQRIFAPFEQGSEHGQGFGLGLALAQRFAAVQDGRIWVEDREGGGAAFHVWLPDGEIGSRHPIVILEDTARSATDHRSDT